MSTEPSRPMPRGRLILAILGAAGLAALVVLGAILPAEFNRDPLGVGKLSGLSRLWAPEEAVIDPGKAGVAAAREYATPFAPMSSRSRWATSWPVPSAPSLNTRCG